MSARTALRWLVESNQIFTYDLEKPEVGGSAWESNPAPPRSRERPILKTGKATGPRSLPCESIKIENRRRAVNTDTTCGPVSTLPACATELLLVQACTGSTETDGPNSQVK